jgi:ArsR family transcriptional regulator
MDASEIFKCLADSQRLRLINLLQEGPLCVCHLQSLLKAPQVKISKQLAYLKSLGIATAERQGTWMIYSLAKPTSELLMTNLKCLRGANDPTARKLKEDSNSRKKLLKELADKDSTCPENLFNTLCCR